MKRRNVLIIGAGGVASVAAHACASQHLLLGEISIASRTLTKCQKIVEDIAARSDERRNAKVRAFQVDAMKPADVSGLIRHTGAEIVINVASSFVNMSVLRACIDNETAYIDTAIHEDPDRVCEAPPWYGNHEWRLSGECLERKVTAILGVGFDPGVVNAYVRHARDRFFDGVDSIDIVDVNDGRHGRWFATNFDPEINFREFTGVVYSWQGGAWKTNRMFEVERTFPLPGLGERSVYLTGHDEIHSLYKTVGAENVRFWMGFGERYVQVFNVLNSLGLLSEKPVVTSEGVEVVPLKVVKAVLPDPASLASEYVGKTWIGVFIEGTSGNERRKVVIYNISDHQTAFAEYGAQAISYTAGLPPTAAAALIARGDWDVGRMVNVEELVPDGFLNLLSDMGMKTRIIDHAGRAWEI